MLHYGSSSDTRQKIFLEFSRDEAVEDLIDEFEKSKNRTRSIVLANSRLIDTKMEKAGNYEINPPAGVSISQTFNSHFYFQYRPQTNSSNVTFQKEPSKVALSNLSNLSSILQSLTSYLKISRHSKVLDSGQKAFGSLNSSAVSLSQDNLIPLLQMFYLGRMLSKFEIILNY